MKIPGALPTAASTPIWPGVAWSVITATKGRAKFVTLEPTIEMVSPVQNRRNCRCPQISEKRSREGNRMAPQYPLPRDRHYDRRA